MGQLFCGDNETSFQCWLKLTVGVYASFALSFVLYVYAEKQIDLSNERRLQAFTFAEELRHTSNDLTRMAHNYVVTRDPKFKKFYNEILFIRDGEMDRPQHYNRIYWDLAEPDYRASPSSGKKIALTNLFSSDLFTSWEIECLRKAKMNSDLLAIYEIEAFDTPDKQEAIDMLFSPKYREYKKLIMEPLNEFYASVEDRTTQEVQKASRIATTIRYLCSILGLFAVILLKQSYFALNRLLGTDSKTLHSYILNIGKGSFQEIHNAHDNSVLSWLAETQGKLIELNRLRNEAEAKNSKVTRLYATLSLCNQAIVRCKRTSELFNQICVDAVTYGEMKMAWVGMLSGDQLIPVAMYGQGTEYVADLDISVDPENPCSHGPTGIAMQTDTAYWCQDYQHSEATKLWKDRGLKFGWKSSCAIPLHRGDKVIGAVTMYSGEVDAFDEPSRNLLIEMGVNIDHALINFEREATLIESKALLKSIVDTVPIRVFWKDLNLRYIGCNPLFAADAGKSDTQEVIGLTDADIFPDASLYLEDDREVLETGKPKLFYEEPMVTVSGDELTIRTSKVPLRDAHQNIIGILGAYVDITEQKRIEAQVQHLANFDPLTGLPNRSKLEDHLNYALKLAKRSTESLSLMFMDLDHFKDVNDTLGHSVGDTLLIEVAHRLRALLRDEDSIIRLGGDEFIFILPGTDPSGASNVAQKILDSIALPVVTEKQDLHVTCSLGIAVYPKDGTDLETLSKNADSAMYKAKRSGRHTYCFFTEELQSIALRSMQISTALRTSLSLNQLYVVLQPQVSIDRQIIGAEALIRWKNPILGQVSPMEFIPAAEDSGYIVTIGEWVLRKALRYALEIQKVMPNFVIAVNLSAAQFKSSNLHRRILRILEEESYNPELLELELTEGVAMKNPIEAISTMDALQQLGVKLSIDDFGTGYSSLSYLRKFKLHKLKIDKSFIDGCCEDEEDRAIVIAVIGLAKSLGLKIIAEGVETEEQFDFLRSQRCDEVQGYLVGKPVEFNSFITQLEDMVNI